jgi:Tfp pilus assembly protein PilE
MRKLFLKKKKGFITVTEVVILTAIIGILAIVILNSTSKTMQDNFENQAKQKIQRDLWANQ